jgi:hypothetical protein
MFNFSHRKVDYSNRKINSADDNLDSKEIQVVLLYMQQVKWVTLHIQFNACMNTPSYPTTRHPGAWWERKYSSCSFSTSALEVVSGQRHVPAVLYPRGKDPRYPMYRRLGRPQSRSGHRSYRKNPLPLLRIEP